MISARPPQTGCGGQNLRRKRPQAPKGEHGLAEVHVRDERPQNLRRLYVERGAPRAGLPLDYGHGLARFWGRCIKETEADAEVLPVGGSE